MKVKRLQVLVLGERDQPLHQPILVPALILEDLDALLDAARVHAPDITYDGLVRAICTYGSRSVARSLKSGLVIRADGSIPTVGEAKSGKAKAAQNAEVLRTQREGGGG